MKRLFIYLVTLFFISQNLVFSYSSNPKEFVNELVSEAINKLADKNASCPDSRWGPIKD